MASHHLQSHSDPNYLLRLQNMHIDDAANAAANKRRSHSLNNSFGSAAAGGGGSIDSLHHHGGLMHKNAQPSATTSTVDYKLFDRNNIIAASKFGNNTNGATAAAKLYTSIGGGYVINNSPTHSLSGSSQHSGSPRASLTSAGGINIGPVYENIEYYAQSHHQTAPNEQTLMYGGNFESAHKKAQPQVPNNNGMMGNIYGSGGGAASRFAHTPQPQELEPTPIYENLPTATGKFFLFFF